MKKQNYNLIYVIGFLILNIVFIFISYVLLSLGQGAQAGYNYSVLKEIESKGFLTTNAYFLTTDTNTHAHELIRLALVRQFNLLTIGIIIIMALISTVIVWYLMKKRRKETE